MKISHQNKVFYDIGEYPNHEHKLVLYLFMAILLILWCSMYHSCDFVKMNSTSKNNFLILTKNEKY